MPGILGKQTEQALCLKILKRENTEQVKEECDHLSSLSVTRTRKKAKGNLSDRKRKLNMSLRNLREQGGCFVPCQLLLRFFGGEGDRAILFLAPRLTSRNN